MNMYLFQFYCHPYIYAHSPNHYYNLIRDTAPHPHIYGDDYDLLTCMLGYLVCCS